MSMDPSLLFFGIVVGSIGLGLFVYGKKQARPPQLAVGLALMVFPYFTTGTRPLVVIAGMLLLALWWMLRIGW
jgi:hypothetical protein